MHASAEFMQSLAMVSAASCHKKRSEKFQAAKTSEKITQNHGQDNQQKD